MNCDGFFSSAPKVIALVGVFPLLLVFLWFTWKIAAKCRDVQTNWTRVEAQVVDASQDDKVTLEWSWRGGKVRQEVKKEGSFKDLAQSQTFPLYMNPRNRAEMRPDTFGEMWGGAVVLGVISLVLAGTGLFLMLTEDPKMPEMSADFAAQVERAKLNPQVSTPTPRPSHDDNGGIIQMREPGESWKANVFWGLLFGLLLLVPAFFAPKDVSAWKKYGMMALGVAWMAFMGRSAIQNHGRTVRCDRTSIQVSQAFGSKRILLSDVKKVTRDDVRQKLREWEDVGRSRYKTKPLDTMAPIVLYILRDAQGKELLRLDKNMEPAGELRRFLDRMENLTGVPIRDE
ncbi:MAG: DUF3592 domain-containing protein [Verrucomicrobia bacterium]|nr:DUF3592 domain-containing protein [Verrucomicrobiota bacterium]